MINYLKSFFHALHLGISTGYHTTCKELLKYRNYREQAKKRVF